MQIINHWPNHELAISKEVQETLCNHLLIPFNNAQEANEYWRETGTCIIIVEQGDDESLINQLGDNFKQALCNAISCYEYKETLASHYTISLSIISDDGAGIYLLTHDNNTLIPYLSG